MTPPTSFLINGRFLTRRATGVDRFARELVQALDELIRAGDPLTAGTAWTLVVPTTASDLPALHSIAIERSGEAGGIGWEQLHLPRVVGDRVLVNLCNVAPLRLRKQAVVVHDIAPVRVPQSYSRGFRAWYRLAIPWLCRRSQGLFTVSSFSASEILEHCRPPRPPVVVTEGCEHMTRIEADQRIHTRLGTSTRPYVLAVGSLAPHKNFDLLVEAMRRLDQPNFDVVIAGSIDPRVFGTDASTLPAVVKRAGFVDDGELKALYQGAACFVFPSLYEGFGLPPVEAMACGCPVLASDIAVLRETCGGAALHFDPHDPAALARLIERVLGDATLQAELRRRSLERAAELRWDVAARALLEGLRQRFMSATID
ncbi:glycosyltransferase family 4 protein [Rivibacter subsaxonicus]|uniref:Glycosyltransferase involved in cell wall biosynthesis n=1 Tax=Rivibacter subsaxonicus TaxID=457575 RepID=A0A4Q7W168_9BURK|nr:glycosyltransferase family 1 protein [Rivibacter subsaxonicus]RZU02269.1 glycosyltransferase involved in cell wall biosynthesis [Rivibacter subsaxonicus]